MNDQEKLIVTQIVKWISSSPGSADIDFYVAHIPEEKHVLLVEAAEICREHLYYEKYDFCQTNSIAWFLTVVEPDQYYWLESFATNSPEAVVKEMVDRYGKVLSESQINQSKALGLFAEGYIRRWESNVYVMSRPEFIRKRLFLNALKDRSLSVLDQRSIYSFLVNACGRLKSGIGGQVIRNTTEEKELIKGIEKYLVDLQLFPQQYVRSNISETSPEMREAFLMRLVSVLAVLTKNRDSSDPIESDEMVLSRFVENNCHTTLMARSEACRKIEKSLVDLDGIYAKILQIFTPQNLKKERSPAVGMIRGQQLKGEERNKLKVYFNSFFRSSVAIQVIIDPLKPEDLLGRLYGIISGSEEVSKLLDEVNTYIVSDEERVIVENLIYISLEIIKLTEGLI